jgi:general L-amino acid transport system substrate-binding protein
MKNFVKTLCASSVLLGLLASWSVPAYAGKVLDGVKQRGVLNCGVHTGRDGFSEADGKGVWSGIDVDYCRALAAAVLGDATKVKYVPTSGQTRITALQSGEIDVLARNTTWTLSREAASGLVWVGVNFYDGQAFMLKKRPDVKGVKDLNASTICVDAGSTTERNLADYFRANNIAYKAVSFDKPEATVQGFVSGRCQVITRDYASLAGMLVTDLKETASEYVILPQLISKEPIGPVVALSRSLLNAAG